MTYTAFLGGKMVYEHGPGVARARGVKALRENRRFLQRVATRRR